MKFWILPLLLLTLPETFAQGIPSIVRERYRSLLPLRDQDGGYCTARATVWQQQLDRQRSPELEFQNVVIYFTGSKWPAVPNKSWHMHIAPAIAHEGKTWVLEKSPYLTGIYSIDQWIGKLVGSDTNPCLAFRKDDVTSSIYKIYHRKEPFSPEEREIAFENCHYTVLSASETNPSKVIEGEVSRRDEPLSLTKYQMFIEQCAAVSELYNHEEPQKSVEFCQKKFPESKFNTDLFNNELFSEAIRDD